MEGRAGGIALLGVQGDLLVGLGVEGVVPVVVAAVRIQTELIGAVGLAVTVKELGAAVGVVVALEHHIDVVLVKDGGELCAEDHAVGVGVIQTGAVDILVDGDHAPGGVGSRGNGLLDGLLVLGYIVIVGVEHDKQTGAVRVVVVAAGLGLAVLGGVGVVEVVGVVGIQGVVVADGGGHGQPGQHGGGEVARVLLLLGLAGLIDLVAGGDDEVDARILGSGDLQGAVPGEGVVAGGGIGRAGAGRQGLAVLGLTLGGADLGVAYIEHLYGVEAAGLVLLYLALYAVLLHSIVISGVGLQPGDGDMVIVVGHAVGQAVVHLGGLAGEGGQVVLVGAEVNHRRGGLAALRLAVPGEVELGLVCAGGEGYLGVVGGYGLPLLDPVLPGGGAAGDAAVVIIGRGGQGHGAGAQDQRAGEDAGQDLVAFLHAFLLPLQFGFGSMEPGGSIAPAAPSYKAPFQSFP